MDKKSIQRLLEEIASGKTSVENGMTELSHLPCIDIDCANLDAHRPLRNGLSEVVYGEGKTFEQIAKIVQALAEKRLNVFGTRVSEEKGKSLKQTFDKVDYDKVSRTFNLLNRPIETKSGVIAVCSAGTADIPVAEEAYRTACFFGIEAKRYYDVGVSGLHRLISKSDELKKSDVIIVVAGMEGALPSVVGGMFHQPIIAVPTSVGYGVQLKGITALMSMLASCAEGVAVVNIDNGFGAACAAVRILNCSAYNN